jgi:hypothetical protein
MRVAFGPMHADLLSAEWCLAQLVGGVWLAIGASITALVAAPTPQIATDLARGVGILSPTWDSGLTRAAAGTLLLELLSTPWRAPVATRARSA